LRVIRAHAHPLLSAVDRFGLWEKSDAQYSQRRV
jgi:hypothetical protein